MREIRYALRRTAAIFVTFLFIGIAFGVLMRQAGYGLFRTAVSSVFIYAGSMQIAIVPLLRAGAPVWSVALTCLFVNARHIFYGIGFIDRFRAMGRRRFYMIYTLADETYSVLCSMEPEEGLDMDRAAFLVSHFNHLYWILGSVVGSLAGEMLPFDLTGIDFAATAFFLVVVTERWRAQKSRLPFLIAAVCSAVCLLLFGRDGFLLPALSACLVLLLALRGPIERKEDGEAASVSQSRDLSEGGREK